MNLVTRYILLIYQVSLMIRDTLEYTVIKPQYDPKIYGQRKNNLAIGMQENQPLTSFLKQNGEVGTKISTQLNEFIEEVYSDESRIVKVEENKVIVDRGLIIQLYDYIVGLHETLSDIINGFVNHSKEEKSYEEELTPLLKYDEVFFRSLAGLTISDEMHRSFVEFNKLMAESKGQPSPQSNFVLNDMKRLVGFFKFVKEHSKIEEEEYTKAYDQTMLAINYMEGSKKLQEGENLKTKLDEVHATWNNLCAKYEPLWRNEYIDLWQQLIEFEKGMQKNNKTDTSVN